MVEAQEKTREAMEEMQTEFALDSRYKAGDSSIWGENYSIPRFAKGADWNFNIIQHYVHMLAGEQRQNRKNLVVMPKKANPDMMARRVSEVRTGGITHIIDSDDMLETQSEWFEDAITLGLSWQLFYRDFSKEPSFGQLCSRVVRFDEIIFDPQVTRPDLGDCDYVWFNKMMSREQLKEQFPDMSKTIDELPSGVTLANISTKRNAEIFANNRSVNKDKLDYNEFYYRDFRDAIFIIDPITREAIEWPGDPEMLGKWRRQGYEVEERKVVTWKQGVVIANEEIYNGKNNLNIDAAPIVPCFCYINRNVDNFAQRYQGVPRGLRDTQFIFNYQTIMQFKMIELQINQAIKYKPTSLVDPEVPLDNTMDLKVALKRDAMMEDFQVVPRTQMDPTIVSMKESLIGLAERITGISAADQGHEQQGDPSGFSEVLRHAKTRIPWQPILDRFDLSFKQVGRIIDSFIQNNWTTEMLASATGMEIPEGWNLPFVTRYDVGVEQGLYTATQQQMQFQQYASLKAMGAPVPWSELFKTAPMVFSSDLVDQVAEMEQKASEMEQQQKQVEIQEKQMEIELKRASAQALGAKAVNEGSIAEERMAKLPAEVAYKSNMAGESEARSVNSIVKTLEILNKIDLDKIKALHSIDMDQLNSLLKLSDALQKESQNGRDGLREEGSGDGTPESSSNEG